MVARGSTLLDLHGIGPSGAARLLAEVGDIHRFASWNGTAPRTHPRANNNDIAYPAPGTAESTELCTSMGVVQLRNPTAGRTDFDAKKAAGKTSMEAMRALKRRLSNVVYARMIADQKRREP